MRVFRGFQHPNIAPACALTVGNFDGVHRGHQAMLALLKSEAQHRGLPATVLTFEPHPRDFFARKLGKPELAPARIATLRDKLQELERCGVDQVVVLRFDEALASLPAQDFIQQVLVEGLGAKYVLVGDDFRFGAKRQGDYATLDAAGQRLGFDVARMMSYEVHGLRVSSSAVREALAAGDMDGATTSECRRQLDDVRVRSRTRRTRAGTPRCDPGASPLGITSPGAAQARPYRPWSRTPLRCSSRRLRPCSRSCRRTCCWRRRRRRNRTGARPRTCAGWRGSP